MIFETPLLRATLVRRYQRFLADAVMENGEAVTAHCPNSGSMLSVNAPGSEVWLSPARDPARRLRYTWELIRVGDALVGINTSRPNAIVAEAIAAGAVPELAGYDVTRREVKYGRNSRIDLLLEGSADGARRPPCYVEVKNVTLRRGNAADAPVEFPDCVTARGAKHLRELADAAAAGARSVMLFLAQRSDASRFAIAEDIDPGYARALDVAMACGVEAFCYRCEVTRETVDVRDRLPIMARHGLGTGSTRLGV